MQDVKIDIDTLYNLVRVIKTSDGCSHTPKDGVLKVIKHVVKGLGEEKLPANVFIGI
jgi:hypothetical protein